MTGTGPEHYHTSCEQVKMGNYAVGVNYFKGEGPRQATVVVSALGSPAKAKR